MTVDAAIRRREEALMQEIGAAMLTVLPVGWQRADLMVNMNAGVVDWILGVHLAAGCTMQVVAPAGVHRPFIELRRLLYRPGRGTFFSARVSMGAPGRIDISYNFDHDPMWTPPLPVQLWARDQDAYPRGSEHIPDWLRARLEPDGIKQPTVIAARRPLDPVGQDDKLAVLATLLVHSLPGDWSQLVVDVRAAGSYLETSAKLLNVFGQSGDWRLPDRALPWLLDLRAGMHREGQGTWPSANLQLAHPSAYSITYDWHNEPAWTHRPPQRWFTEELALFPRSDANIPDWLWRAAELPHRPPAPQVTVFAAPVFDGPGPQGQPLFGGRPAVHPQDRDELLAYLEQAPIVLAGHGFGRDALDPDAEPAVPQVFHTDGTWVWAGAVPYYFRQHRVAPVPQLIKHIRDRDYQLAPLDEAARTEAAAIATGRAQPRPYPDYVPRTISEADRRVLVHLQSRLDKLGVTPHEYAIIEPKLDALVLEPAPDKDGWQVQFWDASRGPHGRPTVFSTVASAARALLAELLWKDDHDAAREHYRAATITEPRSDD